MLYRSFYFFVKVLIIHRHFLLFSLCNVKKGCVIRDSLNITLWAWIPVFFLPRARWQPQPCFMPVLRQLQSHTHIDTIFGGFGWFIICLTEVWFIAEAFRAEIFCDLKLKVLIWWRFDPAKGKWLISNCTWWVASEHRHAVGRCLWRALCWVPRV